jgi:hypothetical protein
MKNNLIVILAILLIGCNGKSQQTKLAQDIKTTKDPHQIVVENEKKATEKRYDDYGELISTISFKVQTDDKDFKDGVIPWASIEKPQQDIPNLIGKDEIVIKQTSIKIIIDYPLTNQCEFTLTSQSGFTRSLLLTEISKHYYKIYEEEESSATIKTIPIEKRTTMYNRNQTNGKYGVWGHDIADLVLAEISLYKRSNGELIGILYIES